MSCCTAHVRFQGSSGHGFLQRVDINQSAHPSQESVLILNTWQRFRRPHSTAGQVNVRNEVVSGPLWFSPYSLIFLPNFGGLSDGE